MTAEGAGLGRLAREAVGDLSEPLTRFAVLAAEVVGVSREAQSLEIPDELSRQFVVNVSGPEPVVERPVLHPESLYEGIEDELPVHLQRLERVPAVQLLLDEHREDLEAVSEPREPLAALPREHPRANRRDGCRARPVEPYDGRAVDFRLQEFLRCRPLQDREIEMRKGLARSKR